MRKRLHLIWKRLHLTKLRWSLILILSFLTPRFIYSQNPDPSPDYREIFGNDYQWAENQVKENKWRADTLQSHGIDPHFALSVIFPELIRYSSISDYVELKALEVLYVQYGPDYADFSVGFFQIKPSFAEHIESDLVNFQLAEIYPLLSPLNASITDNPETRKERITRLKDEKYQLLYLEAFIRIMDILYPEISAGPVEDKLTFYATAYNSGYWKGFKVLRLEGCKAYFHCGIIETKETYSYAGIALHFFKSLDIQQ